MTVRSGADVPAIRAEGLRKAFGKVRALDGVDLAVQQGSVLGLLGPNGAGKTTVVRILTTLLRPDAGRAEVAGFDVVKRPHEVRQRIGLAGQQAAVDEYLTGRGNLEMVGRLYHLPAKTARQRAAQLLESFDLAAAGDRVVKTYSGGMRRRLDLAASLVATPPVVFLDEPTTGLDPRSRAGMWQVVEDLVAKGTTVLLTTQYLEEADRLASQIAVIDQGLVVATGSPDDLKRSVGGERIDVLVSDRASVPAARTAMAGALGREVDADWETRRLTAEVQRGAQALTAVVRELDLAGVEVDDIALRRPTLDEVFLRLTGHPADASAGPGSSPDVEEEVG